MSRPRLSVPKKYCGSPPSTKEGGRRVARRSWSSGSCGAISGANIAVSSMSATMVPPTMLRASRRMRARRSLTCAASAMLQPRIEPGDQHVDEKVDGDEDDGEGEHQPLDQRQIAVDHRV